MFFAGCMLSILVYGCAGKPSPATPGFVPDSFVVPERYEANRLIFRPLVAADAEADYEAVMESRVRLRALFEGVWPADDFTVQQNEADLLVHEAAAANRQAFTYSILSADDEQVLGCLYVYPGQKTGAEVLFWIRETAYQRGIQPLVLSTIQHWIDEEWPFRDVTYLGEG